jgi:membrane fusion protein, copper/silver efflux system
MNMKKRLNSVLMLLLLCFLSCKNADNKPQQSIDTKQQEVAVYTCPMHSEVESFEQGKCPTCNMKLELKTEDVKDQVVSPNKQVLSRQATIKPLSRSKGQFIKANGYIDIDQNRNQNVSVRFGGRIEKLFVKYNYQFVKKGDLIMKLYSPELNTYQEEHLFLLKSKSEALLIEQSRQKLILLGITQNQIAMLEKSGAITQTINVYSPSTGFVLFNSNRMNNPVTVTSQQSSMNGMNMNGKSNNSKPIASSDSQLLEGKYVTIGQTLFYINDLQNVWAIVSIPSEYHSDVKNDKEVKITSELFPDKILSGKIALKEQTFEDNNQQFVRVRIDLPNAKNELKINSLITAEITLDVTEGLQIPVSAVYRTGLHAFVWVKTGTTKKGSGIFSLREVKIGTKSNTMITITGGLSADEEVAVQAGYLTDSETFLNTN